MNEQSLYNSLNLAENIKNIAKTKGVVIGVMLSDLNLGSNTMSNMRHGRMLASDSLARIADYLGVSVDLLLGRDVQRGELPDDERALLKAYREKPENVKNAVKALLEIK